MNNNHLIATLAVLFLVLAVFLSGCSGSQSSSGTASQAGVSGAATTAASSSPLYQAGDILKNPKSSSTSGVLIVSYDAGTDTYARAFVSLIGSSWFRMDSSSEPMDRSTLEKIYTEKITNIPVSQVPIGTPVPTATPVPVTTVPVYSPLPTTATTATTTTSGAAPTIQSISPYYGYAGTSVSITSLAGYNFISGATVQLANSAGQNISATGVSVVSGSTITCTFAIPSNATVGAGRVRHQPERVCRKIQQRVRSPSEHRGHSDHHDVIVRTDYHRYQSYFYDFAKSHLIHDNRDEFHRSSCRQPDKRWPDHPSVYRCVDFFHPDRRILRYPAKYWRYLERGRHQS